MFRSVILTMAAATIGLRRRSVRPRVFDQRHGSIPRSDGKARSFRLTSCGQAEAHREYGDDPDGRWSMGGALSWRNSTSPCCSPLARLSPAIATNKPGQLDPAMANLRSGGLPRFDEYAHPCYVTRIRPRWLLIIDERR
jgi:hypothetical protein